MKKIIDYIPLISGCLLYFGFCHLYYYYQEFNIDIYSFISSTDILLSFFPKIVLITSLFYGAIFGQLYSTFRKSENYEINEGSENDETVEVEKGNKRIDWWRKYISWFVLLYYLPIGIIMFTIQKIYGYKPFELYYSHLLSDIIFLFLVYVAIMIHERRSAIFNQPVLIAVCLIVFIGQKMQTYRTYDAQKIKSGISDSKQDHIVFKYGDSTVCTKDSIIYIGSTSNYIFMYNMSDSSTNIYPLSELKFLTVK